MRPRLVDWSLFALTAISLVTGLISFTLGRPEGRWLFALHGILGLGLVLLLIWKVRRVGGRLVQARHWGGGVAISALALALALLALASGLVWSSWQWPLGYPNGLNWHVIFGIALAVLLAAHMALRFRLPRRRDIEGRRTALGALAVLATGGALWAGQQRVNRALRLPGAQRRFTGSREVGSWQGLAFPTTMWMFDNPPPLDSARWRLRLDGAVAHALTLDAKALAAAPRASVEATLDCTGGWYTLQRWSGIPVAWLLEQAEPTADAVAVSFVSITGYRWSAPLTEARGLLLAESVGDDWLDWGRGAPLRLVAPGRRGFQWVKWVTEVRVLTGRDIGQWGVIFTSGLDG